MAAPLNTCTTIEQRGVLHVVLLNVTGHAVKKNQHGGVWFLWAKDMAVKDIHKEMLPMYGEHCLSRQAVL